MSGDVGTVGAIGEVMKTLPQAWESFVSLVQELPSHPFSQQMKSRVAGAIDQAYLRLQTVIRVVRGVMIRRSLEFANYLEMLEANSIARAASAKLGAQSPLLHAPIPPPTFPDRRRSIGSWRSPPPRVTLKSLALYGADELKQRKDDDFDSAPTAIYHPIPLPPGSSPSSHY